MRRASNILLLILLCVAAVNAKVNAKQVKPALTDTLIYQRDSLFIEALRLKNLNLTDSATVLLLKADSIDPDNAAICYELGGRLIKSDFDTAYNYLSKASELSPDNYYYEKKVITANLYKGDLNAAIAGYEKLIRRYPNHEGDIYDLAGLYHRAGNIKSAIKTYDRLEKLTGTERYLSLTKVGLYLEAGDIKQAHKTLDNLIEDMPLDASLWAYKGDIYMDTRDITLASDCYEKALAVDSLNGYVIESMYIYYVRTGENEKADRYLMKLLSSDEIDYQTKKRYLTQLTKYYGATNHSAAELEPYYKAISASEPENSDASLLYADLLLNLKRNDEAIEVLRSAIYVNAQCEPCWEYLLYQVAQSDDTLMVEKTLADALDAIPESADFYYYSGIWKYSKGDNDTALEYMLKADSIVDAKGGKALTEDNRKDLWNYLFNAYYERGDKERYYYYLEKSLAAFPDDIMGMNNYAYMLAVDNYDIAKAEQLSKRTIEKDPLNYMYLDTYAFILMKTGKLSYAKFYIEQAIEYMKDSPDAIVYEHYGDILYQLGSVNEAVDMWKRAMSMERDGMDKEKLKVKITEKRYVE